MKSLTFKLKKIKISEFDEGAKKEEAKKRMLINISGLKNILRVSLVMRMMTQMMMTKER